MASEQPSVFISYSHVDEEWKNLLVEHLGVLGDRVRTWNDRDIRTGDDWKAEIERELQAASVAVLLVSVSFVNSRFVQRVEIPTLLEAREQRGLRIVPVILRPCAWRSVPWLSRMQVRPRGGQPLLLHDKGRVAIEAEFASLAEDVASWLKRAPATSTGDTASQAAMGRSGAKPDAPRQPAAGLSDPCTQDRGASPLGAKDRVGCASGRTRVGGPVGAAAALGGPIGATGHAAHSRAGPQPARIGRRDEPAGCSASGHGAHRSVSAGRRSSAFARLGQAHGAGVAFTRTGDQAHALPRPRAAATRAGARGRRPERAPPVAARAGSRAGLGSRMGLARAAATGAKPLDPIAARVAGLPNGRADSAGAVRDRRYGTARSFREDLGGGVMLDMVLVPGGTFTMGSPAHEARRDADEGPQHQVTVAPFAMGRFEVTQAQWRAVAAWPQVAMALKADPAYFKGADRPVEQVSWHEAVEFCARLSRRLGKTYRLPSEAEWEYAAGAGTTTPFAFGETITPEIVNYDGNYPYAGAAKGTYRESTTNAGTLGVANAFGLFDLHGNVWEWVQDVWHPTYAGAPGDGHAWEQGGDTTLRVLRGGSWLDFARFCRSALRITNAPVVRDHYFGVRVVCEVART